MARRGSTVRGQDAIGKETRELAAKAKKLVEGGMTKAEVARRMQVTHGTVVAWLKRPEFSRVPENF